MLQTGLACFLAFPIYQHATAMNLLFLLICSFQQLAGGMSGPDSVFSQAYLPLHTASGSYSVNGTLCVQVASHASSKPEHRIF